MRKQLYAANWKMNKTLAQTRQFFEEFLSSIQPDDDKIILIAPPATALATAVEASGDLGICVAAQNCHYEDSGAFTGELSTEMIREAGGNAVIIGHSERRHVFGEDDALINKKVHKALKADLHTILCIGEQLEEREAGETNEVLHRQLSQGLDSVSADSADKLVIAYEPVWAIGTGKTATPDIAQAAHEFVRSTLEKLFSASFAQNRLILYGGSVKPGNIADLMAQDDIDGVLVGGASLEPGSFAAIVNH